MIIQAVRCYSTPALAIIEYVGGKTADWTGSPGAISLTDLTGGSAAEPAEYDFVLIWVYHSRSAADPSEPGVSGYTNAFSPLLQSDISRSRAVLCSKLMGAIPDTTFTPNSATDFGSAHVRVYRFVDELTPFDVATQTAQAPDLGNYNSPSITPGTLGSWIVAFGGGTGSSPGNPNNPADLTGWMEEVISGIAAHASGSGHKTDWAGGAFDPAQVTGISVNGNDTWIACTTALKPAPSITPTFSVAPSITSASGFYSVTSELTGVPGTHNGTDAGYQWKRDGVAIGGETGLTYTLQAADVGTLITFTHDASNYLGTATGSSDPLGPVAYPTYGTDPLIPSGDMQSGTDALILAGDMQSGSDVLLWRERLT